MQHQINIHRFRGCYGRKIDYSFTACTDGNDAVIFFEIILKVLVIYCKVPEWLEAHRAMISPETLICNTAKGLYLKNSTLLSVACLKSLGHPYRQQPYVVLSGPSFAKEMMQNHPTAVVVASERAEHALAVQELLSTPHFRCYTSPDMIGVELGIFLFQSSSN